MNAVKNLDTNYTNAKAFTSLQLYALYSILPKVKLKIHLITAKVEANAYSAQPVIKTHIKAENEASCDLHSTGQNDDEVTFLRTSAQGNRRTVSFMSRLVLC